MEYLRSSFSRFWFIWILLLAAGVAGLTLANHRYTSQNPGGDDFLLHWAGTRALIIDGASPYSDEVAIEIQTQAYGRPARPGEHQLRAAYPLYAVLIFTPYALVSDYDLARALWMSTLEVALIALAFVSLRLTRWKIPVWFMPFFLLFSILWFHGLRPLINGNAIILVALMVAGALLALRSKRDELAGILLAFSTIKPHVVLVIILFAIVWCVSQRRLRPFFWLVATLGLLSALAALFLPDWPLQNLREIILYSSYNPPGTLGSALSTWMPGIGRQLGWVVSGVIVLLLILEWSRSWRKEFRWFLWTACLTLTASQWIGIQTDPENFIILYLPLVLFFAIWEQRSGSQGRPVIWVLMLLLFIVPWALFLRTVPDGNQQAQSPVMFLTLPAFLFVALYWVRWWALRPSPLLVEELRTFDEEA